MDLRLVGARKHQLKIFAAADPERQLLRTGGYTQISTSFDSVRIGSIGR